MKTSHCIFNIVFAIAISLLPGVVVNGGMCLVLCIYFSVVALNYVSYLYDCSRSKNIRLVKTAAVLTGFCALQCMTCTNVGYVYKNVATEIRTYVESREAAKQQHQAEIRRKFIELTGIE